jgi:rubrerythrin
MHDMTASHLRSAFGGESMAHMRYLVWADKADKEKLPNVARLFRAISAAEQVHASNHFNVLKDLAGPADVTAGGGFGLGTTSANLQGAMEGELHEIEEMYPAYIEVAKLQGEKNAIRSFTYAIEAEKIHAEMYRDAKAVVDSGKDIELGTVHVCKVCGWTHDGEAPDQCPICGAKKKLFASFE